MLRTAIIATILILTGGTLSAVLLCVLALRLLLSAAFALSGNRRRMTRGVHILDW